MILMPSQATHHHFILHHIVRIKGRRRSEHISTDNMFGDD
ncbi:hypothetical protein ISN44_As01g004310 [Arabidopsis suecica]|uniref:Uncharacterized protein n=1 Tax=Arabidopsis suecica TaxID=45249 RepID=A0A8T2H038_ARASU|nr:hypothetical protein ISN44_As01g004310 [Arabidopsis suecica]